MAHQSPVSAGIRHTRARSVAIASLVIASLSLTGCAPADPDPDALDAWWDAASERDEAGDLAQVTGQIDRGSVFDEEGGGTRIDFDSPVEVTGVELSCFGEGSMTFSISAGGGDTASGRQTDALECADSPHELDADEVLAGAIGISYVIVDAAESDRRSVWSAVILGEGPDESTG